MQFLDGNTVLATVTGGPTKQAYFYDAKGNNWSAAAWPSSNLSQQVTLTGTRLTVVVGTNKAHGRCHADRVPGGGASLRLTELRDFGLAGIARRGSKGNQGTSTITLRPSVEASTARSVCRLRAVPAGTTVSFNPQTDSRAGFWQLDHDHHGGQRARRREHIPSR